MENGCLFGAKLRQKTVLAWFCCSFVDRVSSTFKCRPQKLVICVIIPVDSTVKHQSEIKATVNNFLNASTFSVL